MRKEKLLAWDMSSFMWTSMRGGKDTENGIWITVNDKPKLVNSAVYGYDIVMGRMIKLIEKRKLAPINCILAFEGQNSKGQRQLIDKEYKAKPGAEKAPEEYEQFHLLKNMLLETWKGLGAQCVWQDFAEGDDVLGWIADNTEIDAEIFTFDNDLTVLNKVNAYGARITTWINDMESYNKYGHFDYDLVTTYKALVGDSSDNIKGCVGFGETAFSKLMEQYGEDGVREIHNMLAASNLSPLENFISGPEDKLLTKIYEQAGQVLKSFDLAKLRPQWVNTMRRPLHWEPGMVRQLQEYDPQPLKKWYGKSRLITADNFEEAIAWAAPRIAQSREIALDIETTTPDESDEWLTALDDPDGVDVFGSTLCGLGLTFGDNNQFTFYFSVDHADTNNIDSEELRQFIASIPQEIPLVIQNVAFELAVLFNEWGGRQLDNGYHGFLPNVLDTAFEANYVNENIPVGLKQRSHGTLGYRQQTFEETVVLTRPPEELFRGGRHLAYIYETRQIRTGHFEPLTDEEIAAGLLPVEMMKTETVFDEDGHPVVKAETRRYKMHELPATHVFGYGADDPICTIALHNYYRLFMQFEHSWETYRAVEINAAYQHAHNFIKGTTVSISRCKQLEKEDDETYDEAWRVVRGFLIENGWVGTQPPTYTVNIDAAQIKEAFTTVTGEKLDTQVRTPSKLVKFIRAETEHLQFADMLELLVEMQELLAKHPEKVGLDDLAKTEQAFTRYVRSYFKGEPQFNKGSPLQMQRLMYDVMGLPIRVRNMPTEVMKKAGIREGTPKTDVLAIAYALQECKPEQADVLKALRLMGMVTTRRSLFYSKYPYFVHWKDGKIRSNHRQCSTVTRRASESKPNKQQLPKHTKIEGQESKFREVIVPHRSDAVIVSMDFDSQEMVLIAYQSQDPNALSCFQGEKRRSPHTITGLGIIREEEQINISYEDFEAALASSDKAIAKHYKDVRNLGKKVNFTAEYGAMAEKVAATLMISVERAQLFLDAREAMYPVAGQWKEDIKTEVKATGVVRTLSGGVRHLADALINGTSFEKSKAERQAVNFKVQGPAGEQTKLAEGRMWTSNLFHDFDAVCIGPIHDELVASVRICDLPEFLPRMHACMVAPFSTMNLEVVSTISFGPNFYRQTEIGAYPTKEAIEKGLAEMRASMADRGESVRDAQKEAA